MQARLRWWMGLAIGAAAAYFFDPQQGRARREQVRDRVRAAQRRHQQRATTRARDEAHQKAETSPRAIRDPEPLAYASG
jgi:gas vesicle protein